MGNMSNPSINRWGLNLFWYKFWFADNKYFLSSQHDFLIEKLVRTYLNFGILYPTIVFIHKYWYKRYKFQNYYNTHNTKYYRIMNFKNLITKEIEHYNERIRIENIYQSRIWILKFQNWILINFYCFNPIKKRQLNNHKLKKSLDTDVFLTKKKSNIFFYKRLKLLIFYFLKRNNDYVIYYNF
jgi:hypothetical protein